MYCARTIQLIELRAPSLRSFWAAASEFLQPDVAASVQGVPCYCKNRRL